MFEGIPFGNSQTRNELRQASESLTQVHNTFGAGDGLSVQQTPGGATVRQIGVNTYLLSFLGIIQNSGPKEEALPTSNEQYWVTSVFLSPPTTAGIGNPLLVAREFTSYTNYWYGVVTNLKETTSHTHSLPNGTIVTVLGVSGAGMTPAYYYMVEGGSGTESKGTKQGQVHTMLTDNSDGWGNNTIVAM